MQKDEPLTFRNALQKRDCVREQRVVHDEALYTLVDSARESVRRPRPS